MIHLDTHVVVWLYAGQLDRFPDRALELLESEPLAISPMVRIELSYLHEINRVRATASEILEELAGTIGMAVDATPFAEVAQIAASSMTAFTRDPFDRVITAQCIAASRGGREVPLITKDSTIREHLRHAVWE